MAVIKKNTNKGVVVFGVEPPLLLHPYSAINAVFSPHTTWRQKTDFTAGLTSGSKEIKPRAFGVGALTPRPWTTRELTLEGIKQ